MGGGVCPPAVVFVSKNKTRRKTIKHLKIVFVRQNITMNTGELRDKEIVRILKQKAPGTVVIFEMKASNYLSQKSTKLKVFLRSSGLLQMLRR